jgi:parallel beta-helix repeat protein
LNKKIIATIFVILLATLLLTMHNIPSFPSSGTTMQVDPPETEKSVCENFYININVTDVEDLREYRFTLRYDTNILDALKVENGGFFKQGVYIDASIDDATGRVAVRGGSTPPAPPVSGDGILAIIEFKCTGVGKCDLILASTSLKDDEGGEISPTVKNGNCTVSLEHFGSIDVYENYTLCHDIVFVGVPGFIIHADDVVLDLNGHSITYRPTGPGGGLIGIEVEDGITINGLTIKNGTINDFQFGIWLENSNGVVISSIDIVESTDTGIGIRNSNDVQVTFNNISGANNDGIAIDSNSFNVSILNSTISASGDVGIGSYGNSSNVSIVNNTVSENSKEGIHIMDSSHNTVSNNKVTKNGYYGLYMFNSNNNTIDTNILLENLPAGMYFEKSNDSSIYHNSFIGNPKDVECKNSINTWDAGYGTVKDIAFGGNYWTSYAGVDLYSGKRNATGPQNVPGCDGIGDTVHTIDANNRDNYPIMEPWGKMLTDCCLSWRMLNSSMEWQETCHVGVLSDSSPKDFVFNRLAGTITFTVNNGTFCRIIVSEEGLCGAFSIMVDGVYTACIINWDKTHYFINFTLPSGNHEVKITGNTASRLIGDLNNDGKVNIIDIAIAAKNFGMIIVG